MFTVAVEFLLFCIIFLSALGLALALVLLGASLTVWAISRGYAEIPIRTDAATIRNPQDVNDRGVVVPIKTQRSSDTERVHAGPRWHGRDDQAPGHRAAP